MVCFYCDACGESLKKSQVQKHRYKCRECCVVSCVDCGHNFRLVVIIYNVVAKRYLKNNSINVFSYQCTYRFILIFLLAMLLTWLINEILLELFTIRLTNTVVTRACIDCLFVAGSVMQLSKVCAPQCAAVGVQGGPKHNIAVYSVVPMLEQLLVTAFTFQVTYRIKALFYSLNSVLWVGSAFQG